MLITYLIYSEGSAISVALELFYTKNIFRWVLRQALWCTRGDVRAGVCPYGVGLMGRLVLP